MRELLDDPRQMALDIIELRAYAAVKYAIDHARTRDAIPDHPMADRVFEIVQELQRRKAAR